MPVITLARQLGSGGEEIAARVGQVLGARVLDGELLALASAQSGIPIGHLSDLDERGRSMWRRPGDLFRLVPMPPINPEAPDVLGDRYPPTGPIVARGSGIVSPAYWALEAYATLLGRTMAAEAAGGDVVLVGRAGNEALRGLPGVLHVLVTGSRRRRIERIALLEGLSGYHALERVRVSDRNRRSFVRQFWNADLLDPCRYDVCVSTDDLTIDDAAKLVVAGARAIAGAYAPPASAPAAVLSGAAAGT
jgi:hypothetical protein